MDILNDYSILHICNTYERIVKTFLPAFDCISDKAGVGLEVADWLELSDTLEAVPAIRED